MPSIRLRGRSYRAEVARYGKRESRTFRNYEQAVAWASERDHALLSEAAPHMLLAPPAPPHEIVAAQIKAEGRALSRAEILSQPRMRPSCGVYFLLSGDEIVYVGQSENVHGRVSQHWKVQKQFDSYTYIPCPVDDLMDLEEYYIREFQPRLNRVGL